MNTRQQPAAIDLRSIHFKNDPSPTWRELQSRGPVVTTRQSLLGRVAFATTHEAATAMLRDTERFTVDARLAGKRQAAGVQWWVPKGFRTLADNMLVHDGAEHRRLRRQVDGAFRGDALARLQPRIEWAAGEAIDRLQKATAPDWLAVAREVPQRVIGELLGLEATLGSARPRFDAALSHLASIHRPFDLLRAVPAIRVVTDQLRTEFDHRRVAPRDDLLTALLAHRTEGTAPRRQVSDDDERISMAFLLYAAGHETTTHLLSVSLLTLLRTPAAREALPIPVTREAVLELLRVLSPVQFTKPRFVTEDLEFQGIQLKRGETISALVAAANQDPARFPDPSSLDFSRNTKGQLGFGTGPHGCLGLQLAVQETATTLTMILQANPDLRLAEPGRLPHWTRRLGLRSLASLPLTLR